MGDEWKPVPRLLIERRNTRQGKVINIVDGDTIDCDIDLGFRSYDGASAVVWDRYS